MFALYNFSTPDDIRSGHCPFRLQRSSPEGVTILDANVASQLLSAASLLKGSPRQARNLYLDAVSDHARAWSCLATCASKGCSGWPDPRGHPAPVGLALRAVSRRPRLPGRVHESPRRSFAVRPTVPDRHARRQIDCIARGVRLEAPAYVYEPGLLSETDWTSSNDPQVWPGDVGRVIVVEPGGPGAAAS